MTTNLQRLFAHPDRRQVRDHIIFFFPGVQIKVAVGRGLHGSEGVHCRPGCGHRGSGGVDQGADIIGKAFGHLLFKESGMFLFKVLPQFADLAVAQQNRVVIMGQALVFQ